jgi:hypothetical protein
MENETRSLSEIQRFDKELEDAQKQLDAIQAKLNKKKLSKKQRRKLKASKAKIQSTLSDIRANQLQYPQLYTQKVSVGLGKSKTVKIPGDNLFAVTREAINPAAMEKLFFDSIGTTEIINVERHDNINTLNAPYQPIVDIASINTEYNPNKIVSLQKTASSYFNTFAIPFDDYMPENGTGPANEIVYVEQETGDLIINVLELPQNFKVEIQVLSFEDILNDTIYMENI